MRIPSRTCVATIALLLPFVATAQAQSGTRATRDTLLQYKGFVVNFAAVDTLSSRDSAVAGVTLQIDLIDALPIADSIKAFFRTVPLYVAPGRGSAAYGARRVKMPIVGAARYDREHPVLLHELCHAYHNQRVPDGNRNAEILALYAEAQKSGAFPAKSYMLSKPGEYFAMMASVYLYGSAARDPFTRATIREKQPAMYAWLSKTFGAL